MQLYSKDNYCSLNELVQSFMKFKYSWCTKKYFLRLSPIDFVYSLNKENTKVLESISIKIGFIITWNYLTTTIRRLPFNLSFKIQV